MKICTWQKMCFGLQCVQLYSLALLLYNFFFRMNEKRGIQGQLGLSLVVHDKQIWSQRQIVTRSFVEVLEIKFAVAKTQINVENFYLLKIQQLTKINHSRFLNKSVVIFHLNISRNLRFPIFLAVMFHSGFVCSSVFANDLFIAWKMQSSRFR